MDNFHLDNGAYDALLNLLNNQHFTEKPGFQSQDLSATLLAGEPSPRQQWYFTGGATAFRSGKYKVHLATKDRSSDPDTRQREPAVTHDPPLLFDLEADLGTRIERVRTIG